MKSKKIKPTGNFDKDFGKAIARFSRETYGFQPPKITKNKKRYFRPAEKIKPVEDD